MDENKPVEEVAAPAENVEAASEEGSHMPGADSVEPEQA